MDILNHYDTRNSPRTNNNVEGYNKKLKNYVDTASPHIFKAVNVFKKEEVDASITYTKALEGARPPSCRKLDIDKDRKLKIYRNLLDKNHITLEAYIENILDIYTFDALEPKKKKVHNAETTIDEDSDESDNLNASEETNDSRSDD